MFAFSQINFAQEIVGVVIAIIQAILVAIITKILLDRAFKDQRLIGKNLQKYGIKKVKAHRGGTLSKSGRDITFGLNGKLAPQKLDLCFITGWGFFRDFQFRTDYLKSLLQRGCKIRVLLANPYRGKFKNFEVEDFEKEDNAKTIVKYYSNVLLHQEPAQSFLERSFAMLVSKKVKQSNDNLVDYDLLATYLKVEKDKRILSKSNGDHNFQVKYIEKICEQLNDFAQNGGNIELRFYEDEYQMPIIMATSYTDDNGKKNNEETIYLWTNINAPIKETSESINVFCSVSSDDKQDKTFINDVAESFDYLWNLYQ